MFCFQKWFPETPLYALGVGEVEGILHKVTKLNIPIVSKVREAGNMVSMEIFEL